MADLTTEYHGYQIIYNEGAEEFQALVDGVVAFKNISLRGLRVQIDNFEKQQSRKDFKRFKVWINNWRTKGYIEGEVTSIAEDGAYWVNANGRTKEFRVILYNLDNNNKMAKMASLKAERDRIEKEYKEVEATLAVLEKGKKPEDQPKKE